MNNEAFEIIENLQMRLDALEAITAILPGCDTDILRGILLFMGAAKLGGEQGKQLLDEVSQRAAAMSDQISESIETERLEQNGFSMLLNPGATDQDN